MSKAKTNNMIKRIVDAAMSVLLGFCRDTDSLDLQECRQEGIK
jgi:hypothetical protein